MALVHHNWSIGTCIMFTIIANVYRNSTHYSLSTIIWYEPRHVCWIFYLFYTYSNWDITDPLVISVEYFQPSFYIFTREHLQNFNRYTYLFIVSLVSIMYLYVWIWFIYWYSVYKPHNIIQLPEIKLIQQRCVVDWQIFRRVTPSPYCVSSQYYQQYISY